MTFPWAKNTQNAGEVKLSGAVIDSDPNNGGGGQYTGNQTLFTLHFRVKDEADLGTYSFELTKTLLCNGPGGWGTDINQNGQCDGGEGDIYETPPVIVTAHPKGSDPWNTQGLNDDFASLLDSFPQNPTATFQVTPATSSTTTTIPQAMGLLTGTLLDATTSTPLGGVMIKVNGLDTYDSSPDGTYQVELPIGNYDVTFMAEGYCSTSISVDIGTASSDLPDIDLDPKPCVTPGWNLVSLYMVPVDLNVQSVLEDIMGSLISGWKWECNEDGSCTWAVFLPQNEDLGAAYADSKGFNLLANISAGEGFWLNSTVSHGLNTSGVESTDTFNSLMPGWNLIGLKGPIARSVTNLISGKENKINSIWKWQENSWAVSLPQADDSGASYANSKGFTPLSIINPGEGFWVSASTAIILE